MSESVPRLRGLLAGLAVLGLVTTAVAAAELQPRTVAAFDRYVRGTEALERDGGTYVQYEAISLTRGIPRMLGWLIGPFVTSLPRESLVFTLETTRKTLASRQ